MSELDLAGEVKALRAEMAALREKMAFPTGRTWSLDQVMLRFGCSRTSVFDLLRAGTLKRAPKAGRGVRISLESILAFECPPLSGALVVPQNLTVFPGAKFDAQRELAILEEADARRRMERKALKAAARAAATGSAGTLR